MKKVFIILFVLFLVAAIGIVAFLASFDAEKYRPLLVQEIESAIGKPVRLDKITMGWHDGMALQLNHLAIFSDETRSEPVIEVGSASALLEILPLLQRKVQIGSIVLQKPSLRLKRGQDGKLRGFDWKRSGPKKSGGPLAALSLLIRLIKLEDGRVLFRDESVAQPFELSVEELDITVDNISLNRPMPFHARAAFLNQHQNLDLSGEITLPGGDRGFTAKNINLKLDLDGLTTEKLAAALPAFRNSGLEGDLSGDLIANIQNLSVEPSGQVNYSGRVHLSDGKISLGGFPVDKLELEAGIQPTEIRLQSLNAVLGGGSVTAAGSISDWKGEAKTSFQVTASGVNLDQLQMPKDSGEVQVRGQFSGSFRGAGIAKSADFFARTASGEGQVSLTNLVVLNLNVIRDVFNRLAIIPGLEQKLKQRLPPSYQEKLDARDTFFESVNLPIFMNGGALSFNNLQLITSGYEVRGAGGASFDGQVFGQMMLRVDPEFSNAFIRSVEELRYLADVQGRLEIPITIQGPIAHVVIMPDLQYVGTKLAVSKTRDLIGGLLEKKMQKPTDPNATPPPNDQTQTSTPQDLLGALLQNALNKKGATN